MKIAILARRLSEPGGGEQSAIELEKRLSEDHETLLIGEKDEGWSFYSTPSGRVLSALPLPNGLNTLLKILLSRREFRKKLEDFDPDLVFGEPKPAFSWIDYPNKREFSTVLFLRGHSLKPVTEEKGSYFFTRFINRHTFSKRNELVEKLFDQSDMIIADSEYLAKDYEDQIGQKPEVVYEFIDLESYKIENHEPEVILHINPNDHKGIDVTLSVAEQLEDEKFVVAGPEPEPNIRRRMEELENLEYVGYVDDMKELYSKTKIVMMPSVWEEPFGRVPVEAGINGIATLTSGKGGLSESAGIEELIIENNDTESYVKKIKEVEQNYQKYSQKARENAEKFRFENEYEKLRKVLKKINITI